MTMTYASNYVLRVVNLATGETVHQWTPGLAAESLIVSELCDRVRAKGVGVGKTEEHVIADVRAAIEELLFDLKSRV
jgi:hypothetical protein